MLAHSLKTYFPSAPRPAGDIAPQDFAQYVKKYPKIAAHVARACTQRQAAFLRYLWKDRLNCEIDRGLVLTCEFIAKRGLLFAFLNTDPTNEATEKFITIYDAITYGMHNK